MPLQARQLQRRLSAFPAHVEACKFPPRRPLLTPLGNRDVAQDASDVPRRSSYEAPSMPRRSSHRGTLCAAPLIHS
eukprot:90539-Chlamydomonas_euryale.AAC.1